MPTKWSYLIAPTTFASYYSESQRELVLTIMREKTVTYPDKAVRKIALVDLAKTPDVPELAQYVEKGDAETLCYALSAPVSSMVIDMPGMVRVDRPWIDCDAGGTKLTVPAEDLEIILERLEIAEIEETIGGPCYEVGFHGRSLIFGESEKPLLVAALEAKRAEAVETAAAYDKKYDAEHPGARERVAKVMAGTHGVGPGGLVELPGSVKPS
jgi:hypothetical protein